MKSRLANFMREAKENIAWLFSPKWAVEEAVASYRVLKKAIPEAAVHFTAPIARRGMTVALLGILLIAAGVYYLFTSPLLSMGFGIGIALFVVGVMLVGLSQYPGPLAPSRPAQPPPQALLQRAQQPPPALAPPPEGGALIERTERLAHLTLEMIQMLVLERAMEHFMSRGPSCSHPETRTEAYHYDDEVIEKVICDKCGRVVRVDHYPKKRKAKR